MVIGAILSLLLAPKLSTAFLDASIPEAEVGADSLPADNAAQFSYEPDFELFDRSVIGRASSEAFPIELDEPQSFNISPGSTRCYVLSSTGAASRRRSAQSTNTSQTDSLDGPIEVETREKSTRQTSKSQLYLSATTCLRPDFVGDGTNAKTAPQLRLLASVSQEDGCPITTNGMDEDMWVEFDEGLATLSVDDQDDPVYVTILAPNVSDDFEGDYNFEVAVSEDGYYHDWQADNERGQGQLMWMDSDSSAALLQTQEFEYSPKDRLESMKTNPPFELYVENMRWPVFNGIERSLCGIRQNALISATNDGDGRLGMLVRTNTSIRGEDKLPRQHFYFEGLNETSTYRAIMVQVANTEEDQHFSKRQTPGEGRENTRRFLAFDPADFATLSGTICKVITDLDFCTENQHAVPGNGELNGTALAQVYDDYARKMYGHFETVLAQEQCETDPTSQYSLARNCDDCRTAYKRWLCTVAIPRCEDYSSKNRYAIPRNVGAAFPNGSFVSDEEGGKSRRQLMGVPGFNASRNSFIDEEVGPGPYKEILPCGEICYEVVQSCPHSMGFGCPLPGMTGFEYSYGEKSMTGALSCNYPGTPRSRPNAAGTILPWSALHGPLSATALLLLLL